MKRIAPTTHPNFWLALFLVFLLAAPGILAWPRTTRSSPPLTPPGTYTITPNSGRAGQVHDVLVISTNANCESSSELAEAKVIAPQGSPISVVDWKSSKCRIAAKIRIPTEAPLGKFPLWVGKEDEVPLGFVEFSITDFIQPGQIPPGMTPAVDIMWSVMPKKIVGDNFGSGISRRYYAIEIIIGNNSAYTLQLVSVGFELPSDQELEGLVARNAYNKELKQTNARALPSDLKARAAATRLLSNPNQVKQRKTLLPTSSYKITRGSLEAKQLLHPRTLVLSTITALGPIFTGFTPYFHNVNHRGNFTEAINIFSNPLEKGLELVWPDPRPRQRERFDDQVLRDGLIIRNNTQVRTLAFFPKDLLRLPGHVETDAQYDAWRNNAREVRERLGEIVIVGDLIQYINRVSLTANAPGPLAPPPTIVGVTPGNLTQGDTARRITISGSNFQGAQLSVSGTTGVHIDKVDVDPNGHFITAEISVDSDTELGTYRINVSTPSSMGAASVEIKVTEPEPEPEPVPTIASFAKGGVAITSAKPGDTIEIIGVNFAGATEVKFGSTAVVPAAANITDTKITVKIPDNVTPADGTDITVTTEAGASPVKKLTITAPS